MQQATRIIAWNLMVHCQFPANQEFVEIGLVVIIDKFGGGLDEAIKITQWFEATICSICAIQKATTRCTS
jgi:hypothetical protein